MKNRQTINNQRGLATVLIVLLVGVSMTAIAMGLARSVKSTQHKQVAVHAATHAQSAAWSAVHIFKEYLKVLDYDDVAQIPANTVIPISLAGAPQIFSAVIVAVDNTLKDSDGIRVTANIKAYDSAAKASSSIQVIYRVVNAVCDLCQLLQANIDLFDDTSLGGDIEIKAPIGTPATVNVEGDVSALNIALIGVTYLNATGDVTLGSAVPLEEVFTNGNLLLDGAANVNKASALGTVTLKNAGTAELVYANSDLSLAGGRVGVANTLGSADLIQWAFYGSILAQGDVDVSAPVDKVQTRGDVILRVWADARDIKTEKTLTCPDTSWNLHDSLVAKVALINCPGLSAEVVEGGEVNVPLMEELEPFTRVKPQIDVWTVKSEANYVFEYISGNIRVTVKNINTIADGTYYVGSYPHDGLRDHRDYLCDAINGAGQCTSPTARTKTICQGYSTSNSCFSYDQPSKTWTIEGKNIVPGVVWFDGNLNLSNGEYYNTFAATGNIVTSGAMKNYAPNFIGYNATCALAYPLSPSTDFANLYPEQLCDQDLSVMRYSPLTNIVLMAGGNDPFAGGVYKGGNITLAAANELFGTVLAGNNLVTGGDTIVHGYVSAAANAIGVGANNLAGKTTIDLDNLPATYRPDEVPDFDGGSCSSACMPPSEGAEVLWTRYL